MIALFEERLTHVFGDKTAGGRCTTFIADVRDSGWLERALVRAWPDQHDPPFLSAAVIAYTMHHFSAQQKLLIYTAVCHRLLSHGVFLNADLFSYGTPMFVRVAQQKEEQWLIRQFSNPNHIVFKRDTSLSAQRERIMNDWLLHLREDNQPIPVHPHTPQSVETNPSLTESSIWFAAGFASVECVFRYYQTGIVWASKSV